MTNIFHFSVDLETMGTRPDAAIVSIGAVKFDPHSGRIGRQFYKVVDLEDSLAYGASVDAGTIKWWLRQSDVAREGITWPENSSLLMALTELYGFILSEGHTDDSVRIWANGPSFDVTILESAYRACNMNPPWRYNSARCVRTALEMSGVDKFGVAREGTEHNALDDAVYQAKLVQAAHAMLWRRQGD